MDAITWINSAVFKPAKSKGTQRLRAELWTPVVRNGLTAASNGVCLHVVHEILEVPEREEVFPRFEKVLKPARQGQIRGKISKWHLLKAAEACGVIARESKNILHNSLNGTWQCAAKSAEYGDATVTIEQGDVWPVKSLGGVSSSAQARSIRKHLAANETFDGLTIASKAIFTHKGDDIHFAVDYKYLIAALKGLPDIIGYRLSDKDHPLYLCGKVDGVLREAVIMPMHLNERDSHV